MSTFAAEPEEAAESGPDDEDARPEDEY